MYGLVNQGIRQMVTDMFGEPTWRAIHDKAGVEEVFVAMEPYPDAVTLKLVAAASEVLQMPPEDVLKAFGTWWIGFAGVEYASLISMAGDSFKEFMLNLNDIHVRVGYMLPKLTPPSFKVIPLSDTAFEVHYHSERQGLFPMVLGMIEGIATRFNESIDVQHVPNSAAEHGHDIYHVTMQ